MGSVKNGVSEKWENGKNGVREKWGQKNGEKWGQVLLMEKWGQGKMGSGTINVVKILTKVLPALSPPER